MFRILNQKEKKEIISKIKKNWDFKGEIDYVFLISDKDKIFIVNREIGEIDLNSLNVNSIGLYIAKEQKGEIRLSIEGSQLIGPFAGKNVIELDDSQAKAWMQGEDIPFEGEGFVIVKKGNDYLGSGKIKEGTLYNYIPKVRRVKVF